MSDLRDRIEALTVRASSPDGAMLGELTNRTRLTLSFDPGWYDQCDESDLERRLGALATRLWAARMRRYWEVLSQDSGERVTGEPRPISPRAVAYRRARDALVAYGESADGRVSVSVEGMRRWTVRVRPGTVRAIDEYGFAAAVGEAAEALIQDQYRRIGALKLEIYG